MCSWIESALLEAIQTLETGGKSQLASDLRRLLDTQDVTSLRIYRSSRLAALAQEMGECDSLEALCGLIRELSARLDVSHCTIHLIRERTTAFYSTKVLTTFPEAWVSEYVNRRYSTIDPIIDSCRRGPGTFFWDLQKAGDDPITRHFIRVALESGIGPSGITRVEETRHGSTVAVSLSSTLDQTHFREAFQERLSDFHEIASLLIDVFSELACESNDAPFNASDDQLKVLRALASGRSMAEVEAIPFLYGSFKTVEKSILKSFGARTLVQAAALASNRGMLEDLPYFAEDVFLDRTLPAIAAE
jgi:hypothetical protein